MKKLVLTSGGFACYPVLHDKFIELSGKKPQEIKILFVSAYPFIETQDDTIHYYDPKNVFFRERKSLLETGFLPENLTNHYLDDSWEGNMRDFDTIYFNGGDHKLYNE